MQYCSETFVAKRLIKGAANTKEFLNFIKEDLLPACRKSYIFILDNVRFHHNKEVCKAIYDKGHEIIYTPPYSPDHDPIERVFSMIKNKVKKARCRSFDCINETINDVCKELDSFEKIFEYSLTGKESNSSGMQRITLAGFDFKKKLKGSVILNPPL